MAGNRLFVSAEASTTYNCLPCIQAIGAEVGDSGMVAEEQLDLLRTGEATLRRGRFTGILTDEEAGPTELGRVARPSRGMKQDLAEVAEGQCAQNVVWRGMHGRRWGGPFRDLAPCFSHSLG